MKLALALLATLGGAQAAFDHPSQRFYVPIPETELLQDTFEKINYRADTPVNSRIALAVLTENTIIWYDHWEDGYDFPSESEHKYSGHDLSSTTEIWGDDDCSNGHAPGYCTNSNPRDILHSGDSIVLEAEIPVPTSGDYNPGNRVFYDGRDKVLATFPIAMVRGAYPGGSPGSMMAGAVEVLETNDWGKSFMAPVGQDTVGSGTNAFEQTMFYVMAKDDNTHCVFYSKHGSPEKSLTLNEGEAYNRRMYARGNYLECTKDVQVDLVTGDENSNYELRWFSLLPTEDWSESYFSPVGDSKGKLRVLVANPNDWDIEVTVETRYGSKSDLVIKANDIAYSNFIGDYTGSAIYTSGDKKAGKFLCLSLTDTTGGTSYGHIYDWGFPVMPTHKLTSEVIVGWGYGCTSQDCAGGNARSVVWVSPVEKADIYVSFNSDDKVDLMYENVNRLQNKEITNGSDLSGAKIWAVKPNADKNSVDTVLIAAAWGQDAQRAKSGDYQALDMGTLVPPLASVRVTESIKLVTDVNGDEKINPGDWVEYTIEVKNAGTYEYAAGAYYIANAGMADNLPFQIYKGSCTFKDHNGNTNYNCNDSALTTATGHASPAPLPKGGSSHYYTFLAQVNTNVETTDISNNGILRQPRYGKDLPFSVPEKVYYNADVQIQKTVYKGTIGDCDDKGKELVEGPEGDKVTYCYLVTNTGSTYLDSVKIHDHDIHMPEKNLGKMLAPGESGWVKFESSFGSERIQTMGSVVGKPVLSNGNDIDTYDYENDTVQDEDDAAVVPKEDPPEPSSQPGVEISKTVHLGTLATCFNGQEIVHGHNGKPLTFCYEVTNTGDVALDVVVSDLDPSLPVSGRQTIPPGESVFVTKHYSNIDGNQESDGKAHGTPVDGNDPVEATDGAKVVEVGPRNCGFNPGFNPEGVRA